MAPNYSSGSVPIGPTTAAWTVDNNNYVRGYVESWNFTVEQRFKTWTASAGYVASRSIDPIILLNENWGSVGTGSAGQVLKTRRRGWAPFVTFHAEDSRRNRGR